MISNDELCESFYSLFVELQCCFQMDRQNDPSKRKFFFIITVVILSCISVLSFLAIFFVFIGFPPPSGLELVDAYVIYDDSYTKDMDDGNGYGNLTLDVANAGTGDSRIESISLYYKSLSTESWVELTYKVQKFPNISQTNHYVVKSVAFDKFTMIFPLPIENSDNRVLYKAMVNVTEKNDRYFLDTTKTDNVDVNDMYLSKDRPDITHNGSLGVIRGINTITPTIADNARIKMVIYEVYNNSRVLNTLISNYPWYWTWNTSNTVEDGPYRLKITVYDYAGLSATLNDINLTVDNN